MSEKLEYISRPPRWESNADVVVVDDIGRELIGRLGNISEAGFMAECEEKVPMGSIVEIELPERGRVRAEVRWVLGWRFGALILPDETARD
jgi:hypothetical protein